MMFPLLLLWLSVAPPGTQPTADHPYRKVVLDLDYPVPPLQLRIHPDLGCALVFSKPYDDSWASDGQGMGKAAYFQYFEFGTDGTGNPDHRKIIIRNRVTTETPVNLFFVFGDHLIEVLLVLENQVAQADRQVRINLVGGEPKLPKSIIRPKAKAPEGATQIPSWARLLLRSPKHKARVAHGTILYHFDGEPSFLYFQPHPGNPPTRVLEVVRGIKKGREFKMAYPLKPTATHPVGPNTLLRFPNQALAGKERLYLRVQVEGERTARVHRLKKKRK